MHLETELEDEGQMSEPPRHHRAPPRTAAERDALSAATHYARAHDLGDPPQRPYLEALPTARRDIRDRLVRGLLRGSSAGLSDPVVVTVDTNPDPDAPTVPSEDFPLGPPENVAVPTGGADRLALLSLPASDRTLAVPVAGVAGFDRVEVSDPVTLVGDETVEPLCHPVDLLPYLRREGAFVDADQAGVFEREVSESVANLALAHVAETVQRERAPGPVLGVEPGEVPAADRPAYLERLVTRGHPFHPGAKIRRGMSPADGLSYAPEFVETVDLRFAAVREDRARRTCVDGRTLTDRLSAAFDGLEAAVERSVDDDPRAYAVVPIHPWQYHNVLFDRYDDRIAAGRVVPVQGYTRGATPLLNLRTVVPEDADATGDGDGDADPVGDAEQDAAGHHEAGDPPPHCKLAIGVRTTNVERTLSPQAVHNGPETTRLWRAIAEREDFDRLGALEERAAASYYPPDGPHTEGEAYDDARHLAGLVRQNPRTHSLTHGDRRVVPAASLTARSPVTGEVLVADAVDQYADAAGIGDEATAARAFVADYADAVVPPQLRLLTRYGVALESHLQNCYAVFEGWRPVGVLVRDFGGIRVHDGRLPGLDFEPYPDSDPAAEVVADLHRKLYYALFQNHLAELVAALVRSTRVDAAACWTEVRDVCRETFDRLRTDPDVPDSRIEVDERALFADPVPFKALTAMRLQGKRHEYVTSSVSNPLTSDPAELSWS